MKLGQRATPSKDAGVQWRTTISTSGSSASLLQRGHPGNCPGAAYNYRQVWPTQPWVHSQGGKQLGLRTWGRWYGPPGQPIRRCMESRAAARVRSFKMGRSQGTLRKSKPRCPGPRSKSGVSCDARHRTTQTPDGWGHVAGKRREQARAARPRHVHAPAGEERGQTAAARLENR